MNDRWWCVGCRSWIPADQLEPHPRLGPGFQTHVGCSGRPGPSSLEAAVVRIPGEAIAALIGAPPEAVEEWLTETVDLLRSMKTRWSGDAAGGRIDRLLEKLEKRFRPRREG